MDDPARPLSRKERIDVLLKEYDALRASILLRTQSVFTTVNVVVTLTAAVATFLLTRPAPIEHPRWLAFLVCLALVGFSVIGAWTVAQSRRAALRVKQIENRINEIAGEELLAWERLHGGIARGYFSPGLASSESAAQKVPDVHKKLTET